MRSTLRVVLPLTAALAASLTAASAEAVCTPTRMLMVVDKSSSMLDSPDASGKSKWQLATEAISQVAGAYENKIDLGINIFPAPSQCAPGKTYVEPGPGNASAIINALGAPPPNTGNYTPMSQSIDVAAADAYLQDSTYRPSILLITDGWQWCSPYDPATRTWPVDSVSAARQKGIKVYVVGFGDAVDVSTLNQMAVASGTAIAGCDPSSTSASGNNCYYQASSGAALVSALNTISTSASAEICNGLDDDCDGVIDNGLVKSCSSSCGSGTQVCTNGVWGSCTAQQGSTEICDGKDNDCDGQVDEGCACTPGDTKACGGGGSGPCAATGVQTCLSTGQWGPCQGAGQPQMEVCNGIDDDCNGRIDDGDPGLLCVDGFCNDHGQCQAFPTDPNASADSCESEPGGCVCNPGEQKLCKNGLHGACAQVSGLSTCTTTHKWGSCITTVLPEAEACNGIDDDCDGLIDNGDPAAMCPKNWVCGDDGRCHNTGVGDATGCGCAIGSSSGSSTGARLALLVLALVLLIRRRTAS